MKLLASTSRARSVSGRAWSLVLGALALFALVQLLQPSAHAETELLSARPGPGSRVHSPPERITLRFVEPVAADRRVRVKVLGPSDENLTRGPATAQAQGISQRLVAPRERGAYQVAYTVVSDTGQVSEDQYWFWYEPRPARWVPSLPAAGLVGLIVLTAAGVVAAVQQLRRRSRVIAWTVLAAPSAATTVARPVPAQRTAEHHEGVSPPGSRPDRRPAQERQPERPVPPRPSRG